MQQKPQKIQEKYTAEIIQKIIREKNSLIYRETFNQPQSMQHKAVYTECHGIITFGNNTKSLPPTRGGGGVVGALWHACIKSLGCEKYLCKICKAWELSGEGAEKGMHSSAGCSGG